MRNSLTKLQNMDDHNATLDTTAVDTVKTTYE